MLQSKLRQLDETFEHFIDSVAIETTEVELTPKLRAERRKRCDNNDFEFSKEYFPTIFKDPFNDLHIHIKKLKTGLNGVSGSRFFGKSAFSYITKIIKPIALGGLGIIGLGQRTQDDAVERTAALVRLMKRNKKLCYDYDINIQQDKKGHYIINNKTLMAFGYREGIRNIFDEEFNRFEIIILDDLYNRISVPSETDNLKVYNFVTSEVTGQLKPGGLCIWLFNFITEDSPGSRFASENPQAHFNLPALDENDETNWKGSSQYTTEYLRYLRETLSFDVWMGDYMNDPVQKGDVFDPDWLDYININTKKFIAIIAAIDPAHGQSPSACYKGICILGIENNLDCTIIDIYLRKENYNLVFDYLDSVRSIYPQFRAVLFENDFNQFFIAQPYYDNWILKRKKYLPIIPYSAKILKTDVYGSDKDSRIMNLVHPFQTGRIKINQDIKNKTDFKLWKNQYINFGKHKGKLDGLDATATAFIMLPRYRSTGKFKSLAKRFLNNEENWLHNR